MGAQRGPGGRRGSCASVTREDRAEKHCHCSNELISVEVPVSEKLGSPFPLSCVSLLLLTHNTSRRTFLVTKYVQVSPHTKQFCVTSAGVLQFHSISTLVTMSKRSLFASGAGDLKAALCWGAPYFPQGEVRSFLS